jgi:uncharacterized protein YlxW (UPF0749 family)
MSSGARSTVSAGAQNAQNATVDPSRPRRPDESMSLLVDIATQALDPGYADAAARRADSGDADGPTRPRLAVVGVLAATLLVVIAAVQAHRHAPGAARSRDALVSQVRAQSRGIDQLQSRLDRLRSETTGLRDAALASSSAGERLSSRLAAEELAAGTLAVTGPGLRVTLDDSADGENQVLDRDLQSAVNALWAAGAEAVAVDGQRMTAQSAIRQAGQAILVNFEPVTAPYELEAVGDPVALETSFASSQAASRLRAYEQLYGLRFHYARADSLTLPPAPGLTLRYAHVATTPRSGP